jgi:hypothetical protein
MYSIFTHPEVRVLEVVAVLLQMMPRTADDFAMAGPGIHRRDVRRGLVGPAPHRDGRQTMFQMISQPCARATVAMQPARRRRVPWLPCPWCLPLGCHAGHAVPSRGSRRSQSAVHNYTWGVVSVSLHDIDGSFASARLHRSLPPQGFSASIARSARDICGRIAAVSDRTSTLVF